MSNSEKLKVLMRSTEVRDRIAVYLRQNVINQLIKGYMDSLPILKVGLVRSNRRQR